MSVEFEIEELEVAAGWRTYPCRVMATYEAGFACESYSHNCAAGDDSPDCSECGVEDLEIEWCVWTDEDGTERELALTEDEAHSLYREVWNLAEDDCLHMLCR